MREFNFEQIRQRLNHLGYDASSNAIGTSFTITKDETNLFQDNYFPSFANFAEGFMFAHYLMRSEDEIHKQAQSAASSS